MGGISVMLLMGMLSAMYVFFIAVISVLIIYFAVSYVFESIAAMGMCKNLYYKHSGTATGDIKDNKISTAVQLGFRFIINISSVKLQGIRL